MVRSSRYSVRDIALLSILSALWAVFEIKLGFLFRVIKIPFWGTLLTVIAILILFLGRDAVNKRGTAIFMGLTTAFLKLIYLGGMSIFPVLAVVTVAFVIEAGLMIDRPKKIHHLLAAGIGLSWSFLYPFLALGILSGWGISKVYFLIVGWGVTLLGIPEQHSVWIFSILLGLHILLGIFVGLAGWRFSKSISKWSG